MSPFFKISIFILLSIFIPLFCTIAQVEFNNKTIKEWREIFNKYESFEKMEGLYNVKEISETNANGYLKTTNDAIYATKLINNKLYVFSSVTDKKTNIEQTKLEFQSGFYFLPLGNNVYKTVFEDIVDSESFKTYFNILESSDVTNSLLTFEYGSSTQFETLRSKSIYLKLSAVAKKIYSPRFNNLISISNLVSQGTGFIINNEGYIITNNHVVRNGSYYEVVYNDKTYKAKFVAESTLDLSILKIDSYNTFYSFVNLGNSDNLKLGTKLFALGFPLESILGNSIKLSDGILSSVNGFLGNSNYFQTSATLNEGNSGGPIFGESGAILGVSTSKLNKGDNIYYGLKINKVKDFLVEENVNFVTTTKAVSIDDISKACVVIKVYNIK